VAAPAFGSVGTLFASATSTPAFAVPANVASGDIIVVGFFADASTTTITAFPSGFVEAENSPVLIAAGSGGNHTLHVAWKRATGADSGTYSFTLSANVFVTGNAVRYTGAIASGNPWDPGAQGADGGTGTSNNTPDVNITTAGSDRLLFFVGTNLNGDGGTWSPPTGFSERAGGSSASDSEISDKVQAVAGATGNTHASNTSAGQVGSWMAALIGDTALGRTTTNRHPGKGPGKARFFQTPRSTSAGNVVTIDGSLTVTASRTATVAVTHTVGGSLTVTANRTATVAITHTVAGSLTVTANRTATVAVTHTIGGSRPTTVNRTATVAVTHTITGSLVVTASRTATVAVTHTISGSRPVTVNRTATVAATHTISGSRPITVGLAATADIPGVVTIGGSLVVTASRTATVAVVHTVSGSLIVVVTRSATAGGSQRTYLFLPFFG
jgi:hypothetical protein